MPETPVIPDKLYFRIGDVARLCEVPAYVLRFWETEFPNLKPNKGGTGQRLYRRRDVEMALRIKSLLYDQGYTIPGARQVFKSESRPVSVPSPREISTAHDLQSPLPAPSPLPTSTSAPATDPGLDVGAAIRQQALRSAGLSALREQMQALRDLLGGPVANTLDTPPAADTAISTPAAARPLRPRLVLEPRHTSATARHESRLHLEQRDLFAPDSLEFALTKIAE